MGQLSIFTGLFHITDTNLVSLTFFYTHSPSLALSLSPYNSITQEIEILFSDPAGSQMSLTQAHFLLTHIWFTQGNHLEDTTATHLCMHICVCISTLCNIIIFIIKYKPNLTGGVNYSSSFKYPHMVSW